MLVIAYALFVVLFTAAHGIGKLGNALAMPVPLALVPVMFCLFPVWAGDPWSNWALAGEMMLFVAWNLLSVHHRFSARLWVAGLISVPAVNFVLNLLFVKFAG